MVKPITIYTDGSCLKNPGPGGYGVVLLYGEHRKELSGGFQYTTNNRMEILAAIVGLEALKEPCQVELYSDSQYVVNAISKGWAKRWQSKGWMRNKDEKALNPDLWERLLSLCDRHQVTFNWVRGHSGNVENERCDRLAVAAAKGSDLEPDTGYEQN
ncbi:MAG: ribonuclease HI [Prochlorotrichaceae cyanobacterium]